MIHQLAGILTDRHRQVIHAVVDEHFVSLDGSSVLMEIMPITDVPAAVLEHEVLSGMGGKTQERVLDEPGKSVVGPSSTSKLYEPGSYQENIRFGEKDLLKLRRYGSIGERGATGLTRGELDHIERAAQKLTMRLMNRVHQLGWDAMFNGSYVYQGITKSFGIPAGNLINAATDWSVANTGTPFEDLLLIVNQNAVVRKYRNIIKGFVINPKTEADIMFRALEAGYVTNANIQSAGINEVRKFAAPGLPEFIVVDDAIQEETVDAQGNVTLGNATFLVPDDKVLILLDFNRAGRMFPKYGEIQLTENFNDPSASLDNPAVGMYTFLDEKGLEKRENPSAKVVSGFNGGPNLMRPFDTLIVSV